MKRFFTRLVIPLIIVFSVCGLAGCDFTGGTRQADTTVKAGFVPDESGTYTSMSEVAAYIHTYDHLPDNYITKSQAKKLGWQSESYNLWDVAPGKSIGGDSFGNYENKLPNASKRKYYECDIDYSGGARNAKRLVYSNDGLIFYTKDHYQTYTQIYPEVESVP